MPGYFDDATLQHFADERKSAEAYYEHIKNRLFQREYVSPAARDFAFHGLSRRCDLLLHAINTVFDAVPPDAEETPPQNKLFDATIALHAFVFNCFGCLDNLAWLWVSERDIKDCNGRPLDRNRVGLGKKCREVRASFSAEFNDYLDKLERWLTNLIGFRDALAHRIPLYIPPAIVLPSDMVEFTRLDKASTAAIKNGNWDEYGRLQSEQTALSNFLPLMTYTYKGLPAEPIIFHGQIISDHETILELTSKLLDELES